MYCTQDLYKFCSVALVFQISIFCLYIASARKHNSGPADIMHRVVDVFIAAVPTGIPTVLIFSLGTRIKMLKSKQIDILAVDKLKTAAAVEVVCMDKTGTLTSTVVSHLTETFKQALLQLCKLALSFGACRCMSIV